MEKVCSNSQSLNKTRKVVFVNMDVFGETFSRGTFINHSLPVSVEDQWTDSCPRKSFVLKDKY